MAAGFVLLGCGLCGFGPNDLLRFNLNVVYCGGMKKASNKNPNTRWGVGPAAGSQRSRVFTDRKKSANRNACRGNRGRLGDYG